MCIICRNEYSEETEILDISGCKDVRKIPLLPRLKELNCQGCSKIRKIPLLPKLKILECGRCVRLKKIPALPRLKTLYCFRCCELREIRGMRRLRMISCSGCPKLREIRGFPRLESMYCMKCPKLTVVPSWRNERGKKITLTCDKTAWFYRKNLSLLCRLQSRIRRRLNPNGKVVVCSRRAIRERGIFE